MLRQHLKSNLSTLLLAALAAALPAVAAAEYPERAVKLVVPYTPGGPADLFGRFVAQKLGPLWRQQVVIENKPGAGLAVGANIVIAAPADGYSVLLGASSMFVDAGGGRTPADNLRDLAPVSVVGSLPLVLVTSNALGAGSVRELIAMAKARPGQLNYGSSGNGSLTHMAGVLFGSMTGAQIVHVPYRGINEALIDVTGGRVQMSFAGAPIALPLVRSGQFKALAVTGSARSVVAPELPTIAEGGLAGYEVTPWYGAMVRSGTPADIIARLHRGIVAVMQTAEVQERWKGWGADASYSKTPEEFGAVMRAEVAKWEPVVKAGLVK